MRCQARRVGAALQKEKTKHTHRDPQQQQQLN